MKEKIDSFRRRPLLPAIAYGILFLLLSFVSLWMLLASVPSFIDLSATETKEFTEGQGLRFSLTETEVDPDSLTSDRGNKALLFVTLADGTKLNVSCSNKIWAKILSGGSVRFKGEIVNQTKISGDLRVLAQQNEQSDPEFASLLRSREDLPVVASLSYAMIVLSSLFLLSFTAAAIYNIARVVLILSHKTALDRDLLRLASMTNMTLPLWMEKLDDATTDYVDQNAVGLSGYLLFYSTESGPRMIALAELLWHYRKKDTRRIMGVSLGENFPVELFLDFAKPQKVIIDFGDRDVDARRFNDWLTASYPAAFSSDDAKLKTAWKKDPNTIRVAVKKRKDAQPSKKDDSTNERNDS